MHKRDHKFPSVCLWPASALSWLLAAETLAECQYSSTSLPFSPSAPRPDLNPFLCPGERWWKYSLVCLTLVHCYPLPPIPPRSMDRLRQHFRRRHSSASSSPLQPPISPTLSHDIQKNKSIGEPRRLYITSNTPDFDANIIRRFQAEGFEVEYLPFVASGTDEPERERKELEKLRAVGTLRNDGTLLVVPVLNKGDIGSSSD